MSQQTAGKPSMLYNAFRAYLRFFQNTVYYKKVYIVNREAVPEVGTPLLIVSNHQNCLNDPLGVVLSFNDRVLRVMTRANVFAVSPVTNKLLRAIGLLPAFRLGWEGEAALSKNDESFKQSEEALLNGSTVMMYPEGGHQDKRWLGNFSMGYTKLAFEAAEMGNFEKEIFILPSCNHYSDYFGLQNRFMIKYGTPISLKPYYELYQSKPRTAQREVNKLVREQIEGLMLNINDLDNYEEVYFLATDCGREYAISKGIDADSLPEMLLVQREITEKLTAAKQKDEAGVTALYAEAKTLREGIEKAGLRYEQFYKTPSIACTLLSILLLFLLFPIFVWSLWPALFIYAIGYGIYKKLAKDPMFEGTFVFAASVLITIPLFSIIMFITDALTLGCISALIHLLLLPAMMLIATKYFKAAKRQWQNLRYLFGGSKVEELKSLKEKISNKLKSIL